MQVSHLYKIEIDSDADPILYQTVELLKQAITDWPAEVKTVEDFLQAVEKYLHCSVVTADVVEKAASHVGSTSELWQMEALASIQELMSINQNNTLEGIIKGLILLLR